MEVDLPGPKNTTQDVICPLAMHLGSFPQGINHGEDAIDFLEIAKILFKWKYFILAVTLIAAIAGLVHAESLPNIYKSDVLVVSNNRLGGAGNGGASLANQFGGLASAVLGVSLRGAGEQDENSMVLAVMRSRPFAEYTIKEFNLMPLLAVEINKENPATVKLDDAVSTLLGGMKIKEVRELRSGATISFSSKSPELSAKIVETLVASINKYYQYDTIERAKKTITVADAQIQQTTVAVMQKVLWDIVLQETMEIVKAQAQNDFCFRIIEPAVVPKNIFMPHRGVIVAQYTGIGFLIGFLAVLLWNSITRKWPNR